jgi:hypothetical protein
MLRRAKPSAPLERLQAWQGFANRLGFAASPGSEANLRTVLNLEPNVLLEPIYRHEFRSSEGKVVRLYLLDYLETRQLAIGRPEQLVSVCVLSSPESFAPLSLKAWRKAHKVMEAIEASKSGGQVVSFPDDAAFAEKVTVFARDSQAARQLLTADLRALFLRALCERSLSPTLLLGEKRLVLSQATPATEPMVFEVLEDFATDLLGLYSLLTAVNP